MIKYCTYSYYIEAKEVLRETNKELILMNGRREIKHSKYHDWFNTWDEAHDFLLRKYENQAKALMENLERVTMIINDIKDMKPF